MGRPLNKKFFGNRNIGSSSVTTDNGLGGEGVASISNGTVGAIQINDTYKTFPGLTAAAPTLPGGVTSTLAVTWEVATVSLSGGTGYTAGAITSITGLDTYGNTDTRFTVTVDGSGVPTFGAFTERGSYTSIDGTGITTWAVVQGVHTGAQATVTFRVKSIAVTEKGSGYVVAPALSWTQVNGGTMPSAQSVTLTTDSGQAFSATNQENAIIAYAYIPVSGTAGYISGTGGSSSVIADIQKQTNDRRYKVKTAQGVGLCKLVAAAPAAGQMTIKATDQAGCTYYVTKLTSRKAVLVPFGGGSYQFPVNSDGTYKSVKWTFGSAVAPSGSETGVVTIENA